jgi:hypothetical protein
MQQIDANLKPVEATTTYDASMVKKPLSLAANYNVHCLPDYKW